MSKMHFSDTFSKIAPAPLTFNIGDKSNVIWPNCEFLIKEISYGVILTTSSS